MQEANYRAWFEKYRPRLLGEVVFPNQDIRNIISAFYEQEYVGGNILSYGPPGFGKAQPNTEKVLTPDGWAYMGDIKKGDFLISRNGSATKVLDIFPQGEREIYKLTFADGNSVKCDGDHIWSTWQNSSNTQKKYKNRTTKEMLNYKHNFYKLENTKYGTIQKTMRWSVPLPEAISFNTSYYPIIDPYALGLLLGDGSFRGMGKKGNLIKFSDKYHKNIEKLYNHLITDFDDLVITPHTPDEKDFILRSPKLANAVRILKLDNKKSVEKFIPEEYIYLNNPILRKKLIDGLLDTDSYKCNDRFSKNINLNSHEYYTISSLLMDGFIQIIENTGIHHNPVRVNLSPKYNYKGKLKTGSPAYSVIINTTKKRKSITNIEKLDYFEESTCVMVDNPEHLYITTGCTVTHNTTVSEVLIHRIVKDPNDIFILGRKTEDVDNLKRWLQQRPVGSKQKIVKIEEMDRLSSQAQVVLKDGLMEKYQHNTAFLATTNNPEKIDPALITRFNTKINFGELPNSEITERLKTIFDAESISFSHDDLNKFVDDYSKRGLRDMINNLELSSQGGAFDPSIMNSFIGITGNEDLVTQYIEYLVKYVESKNVEEIQTIINNPKADAQFYTYYEYMLHVLKNELRLNYHSMYKTLFEGDLDLTAKNIIETYWQELDLKRFKHSHTIAMVNSLVLNIKEQKGSL